jgi:hypothetical protein
MFAFKDAFPSPLSMTKFLLPFTFPGLFLLFIPLHVCSLHTSTQDAEVGGSRVQGQPGLHIETLSQNKKAIAKTKAWGCSSVVEHLLSMHKVLGLIPKTAKQTG